MLTPLGSPSVPSLNSFPSPALTAGLGNLNSGLPMLGGLPTDGFGLSPEAAQGGLSNAGDLGALLQSLGAQMDPKQMKIMQLQQEMQQIQEALTAAQASGNQPMAEQLQQRLQQIQAELQQLMGGEGHPAGSAADPMGGAGSPGGGEAPMGGAPGGGSPGGGSPGGGAPSAGGPGGSPGGSPSAARPSGPGVGTSPASPTGPSGPATANAAPSPSLQGDDAKMAAAIEQQLQGTPLANQGLGAHFVAAGRQRNVDPMALLAISKHETNHGKLGVGIKKHMGVGAYDNNPNGRTPFDGAVQQIYSGAKTFDNLRRRGGSNANAPMSAQLAAVNRAGWATDRNWHSKVGRSYNTVVSRANQSGGNTQVAQNRTPRSTNRT